MRTKVRISGWLCFALLAAGLLLWAPPADAASNPEIKGNDIVFPPGFDKLVDKMYHENKTAEIQDYSGATDDPGFSRFSVKLYGGYSYLLAADINEGSDGYFELLELYNAWMPDTTLTGAYKPVHGGLNFGADFIYEITPNIGVGLGIGYLRSSKTSHMSLSDETGEIALTATPTISAMPVKLGVFFTVPMADKINLTADVGAAYYAGLKFDALMRVDQTDEWMEMSLNGSRSSDIGFQGSLGFEYKFSPKMGFFVEAVGRYARFKTFDLVTAETVYSGGGSDTEEGKLYIATYTDVDPEGTFSFFWIGEDPINSEYETFTEPKIDLSGFSLQAGFRIRF
jgi:hypothetical protein